MIVMVMVMVNGDGDCYVDSYDGDDDYNFHVPCLYPPKDPPSVGWMRSQGSGLGGVRESHRSKYPHISWSKHPYTYIVRKISMRVNSLF